MSLLSAPLIHEVQASRTSDADCTRDFQELKGSITFQDNLKTPFFCSQLPGLLGSP
jgi:hypothetical protein